MKFNSAMQAAYIAARKKDKDGNNIGAMMRVANGNGDGAVVVAIDGAIVSSRVNNDLMAQTDWTAAPV